ncbi:MAG: hypothetical protein ABEJ26_04395, partial [Halosimplex sp.]
MIPIPRPALARALQVSATGGSALVAALALLGLLVAAGLSLLIAYQALREGATESLTHLDCRFARIS